MGKQIDRGAANPRMQCDCCGRWMRLHGKRLEVVNGKVVEVAVQRFYGSCEHNRGGDHLAGSDVCVACCETECKSRCKMQSQPGTPAEGVSPEPNRERKSPDRGHSKTEGERVARLAPMPKRPPEPPDHADAWDVAHTREDSNLARCYLELRRAAELALTGSREAMKHLRSICETNLD